MSSWMTPHQRLQWQMNLELKLRQLNGDAFQDFFSRVMARLHGADFIRVRPFGSLGDKGCDGYLQGSGQLFQCYGKLHDAGLTVSTLVAKMTDDYVKASVALSAIMKEWHFVHNLVDGVPVEAVVRLKELEAANSHHRFGMFGPPTFEDRILALDEFHLTALLGPVASAEDSRNMRIEEVAGLIEKVMRDIDDPPLVDAAPTDPPFDKLDFNGIRGAWHGILVGATSNAPLVKDYVDRHPDPQMGIRLSKVFANRYKELDASGLSPNAILTKHYEDITGVGSVPPERQVAAQALLAYLFEACDIFKDHPSKVTP
ncbi:hypothetical protein ASF25_17805 [Methylobacterium sp. Leaf100]|nr:hypothetical protein ASF25_17805 [Methylobacterium sp. Leaf100]